MPDKKDQKTQKKGFFARLLDSIDKKMAEKAGSCGSCCCSGDDSSNKNKKC